MLPLRAGAAAESVVSIFNDQSRVSVLAYSRAALFAALEASGIWTLAAVKIELRPVAALTARIRLLGPEKASSSVIFVRLYT